MWSALGLWEGSGSQRSSPTRGLGVVPAVLVCSGSLCCLQRKMTQPVREWRFSKAQISAQVLDSVSAFIIDWPIGKATVGKYGSEMALDKIFFQLGVTS